MQPLLVGMNKVARFPQRVAEPLYVDLKPTDFVSNINHVRESPFTDLLGFPSPTILR